MIDIDLISRHTIFLHGTSGAGKSVLQEGFISRTQYYEHNNLKVLYLSSGDCFRELAGNTDIANRMRSGKFIPTLKDIMPVLENRLLCFIKELACPTEGKRPIMMLDGFLRIGKYKDNEGEYPSQIDQIACAFQNVMTRIARDPELKEIRDQIDPSIFNLIYEIDNPYIQTGEGIQKRTRELFRNSIKQSHHYYVDVTPEDAETLMRFRSEKAIKQIIGKLEGKEGCLGELRQTLETALLIQQGKYKPLDGRNVEITKETKNDFSLKSTPKNRRANLDEHMARVIRKVNILADLDPLNKDISLTKAINKICKKEEIDIKGIALRDDDLTFKSREKRIKEFQTKTVEGLLIGELGFSRNNDTITAPTRERTGIIPNGPIRGIGYEIFRKQTLDLTKYAIEHIQINDRGRVFAESHSRSTERA